PFSCLRPPVSTPSPYTTLFRSSSRTPSDSSTSAEPLELEAARLPCLTTTAPAPAIATADIDEMLTVLARSPPVPTMSTMRPATESGSACSYMVVTRPSTSSTVSPLARNATAKPAIRPALAAPDRISLIAQAAVSRSRSRPSTSVPMMCDQVWAFDGIDSGRSRERTHTPDQVDDDFGQGDRVDRMRDD